MYLENPRNQSLKFRNSLSSRLPSSADESIPPELERDFFTHLYTGETAALDAAAVPEDYYTYLEGWYR